jgi:hypothetical protein
MTWAQTVGIGMISVNLVLLVVIAWRQARAIDRLNTLVCASTFPADMHRIAEVLVALHDKHVQLSGYTHESVHKLRDGLNSVGLMVQLNQAKLDELLKRETHP